MTYANPAPIMVYDGDCGFCTRSVRFVLDRDRKRLLCFASRDGVAGQGVRARHPELQMVDSLLWVERVDGVERVMIYSDAALAVARYLGGIYGVLAMIGAMVPRALRDPAYKAVAKVRRSLMGGASSCMLPSPAELGRMLP
jgi:predicted DCC family thiol-disulfide oxidoreductase YuxK